MTEFYYFSTTWCQPCKAFKPVAQQAAAELGINLQHVDAGENRDLAARLGVSSVPTIVAVQNGQILYKRVGAQSKAQLVDALSKLK